MAATLTPSRHDHPFAHSFSQSLTAPPPTTSINVCDTLPSIDFDFASLRAQMAAFTTRFDAFIQSGRTRVLHERNAFRLSIAEVAESTRSTKTSLVAIKERAAAHEETLAREEDERQELKEAVEALSLERQKAGEERERVLERIGEVQGVIGERRAERSARTRYLEAQGRLNGPELRFWEQSLGLRIEGVEGGKDRVKFVFCCVDERAPDVEGGFILDMGGKDFEIVESSPALEEDGVAGVVERFNGGGSLAELLKGMRGLIVRTLAEK